MCSTILFPNVVSDSAFLEHHDGSLKWGFILVFLILTLTPCFILKKKSLSGSERLNAPITQSHPLHSEVEITPPPPPKHWLLMKSKFGKSTSPSHSHARNTQKIDLQCCAEFLPPQTLIFDAQHTKIDLNFCMPNFSFDRCCHLLLLLAT